MMMELLIEILGWIASVLIVGAYFFNIRGKLSAQSPLYIWSNLVGGLFFIINTIYHGAYPSALVNVVWVIIAVVSLITLAKTRKQVKNSE
ncbi:CBU_0592 family membrane protein [Phnomibacter sp. MR]|uniref:CBU_0592 family membrane protein n=1 Tax=Phnomibacter sp. MR TaxID=3042318 RepID=UPI003A80FABC